MYMTSKLKILDPCHGKVHFVSKSVMSTSCTKIRVTTHICTSVPVYQCHYLHRAQSLLWWHVPSVPVSLFTPCTESVVVTCTCTQCTSVTIYTVHRVCCGDMYMYPVYQCRYLHRAQSLLWWHVHVPSVPVSLFTLCTESVVVTCTCTQCTSVTIYTVHRVCCSDMYPVYQCTSVTIYTVHRVCCGDMYMYPVYQCHYLHRAQSLL